MTKQGLKTMGSAFWQAAGWGKTLVICLLGCGPKFNTIEVTPQGATVLSETYTMATLPWVAGKFGVAEAAVIEVVEQSKAFDTIIPRQLWTQKLSQISGFTFIVVRPEVLFVSGYYDGRGEGVGVCAPNLLGIYAHEFVTFLLSDDFFFLISERDLGKLGPGDILYDVESSIAPLYVAGTTIKECLR